MNIWLKTQITKQAKLRQSLAQSSVASLRSPLPIIIQNEKIDDVVSNSNISISLKSQSVESKRSFCLANQGRQYTVENQWFRRQRGSSDQQEHFQSDTVNDSEQESIYQYQIRQHFLNKVERSKKAFNEYSNTIQNHKSIEKSQKPIVKNIDYKNFGLKQKMRNERSLYNSLVSNSSILPNSSQSNKSSSSKSMVYRKNDSQKLPQNKLQRLKETKEDIPAYQQKNIFENNRSYYTSRTQHGKKVQQEYEKAFKIKQKQETINGNQKVPQSNYIMQKVNNYWNNKSKLMKNEETNKNNRKQKPTNIYEDPYRQYDNFDMRSLKMQVFSSSGAQKNASKNVSIQKNPESSNSSSRFQNSQDPHHMRRSESTQSKILMNIQGKSTKNIKNPIQINNIGKNVHQSISNSWRTGMSSFTSLHMPSSQQKQQMQGSNSNHSNPKSNRNSFNNAAHINASNHHTNSKRLLTTGRAYDRRQYIVSIIEYCSNQVGLACYHINTGQIKLTQIIQRITYMKTISTLERFYPQEIIFSITLEDTLLMKKLMNTFRRTAFKPVKRSLFDETKGYYIYSLRGNKTENNPDHKFLSYAALHALLITMESTFEFTLTYSALNIKWHFLDEVLVIDSQTVADLQIFINKQTKIIRNTFIDDFKCVTDGGTRLLRANFLQPLTEISAINERYDLVQILLKAQNKIYFQVLVRELSKFKNYQSITAKFIQSPKCQNIKSVKSYLNAILMLSRMCYELQTLQKKLGSIIESGGLSIKSQNGNKLNSIIKKLHQKLNDERLTQIRKIIQDNFDPQILKNYQSTNLQNQPTRFRGSSQPKFNNVKPKRDSFIFLFKLQKIGDQFAQISRLTYSHTIEDILKQFQKIKQKCPLQNHIKLLYSEHRGYYLSCRSKQSHPIDLCQLSNSLQDDIIFINKKGNTTTLTTSILISLNNRLKQNQNKLIYQSMEVLLRVIKDIQKYMQVLFQVNYQLSMIDMIGGFVNFVKIYTNSHNVVFCKPKFVKTSTMKIQKLRTIWTMQKFHKLSTDISLSLHHPQSTLIIHKQLNSFDQLNILYSIGFLTILSQIGCLVPAQQFVTTIYSTLISKMQVQGNLQNKMSHFQSQLVVLRNILENSCLRTQYCQEKKKDKVIQERKGRCLILIDQICKGTKPEEQYALSMASVEQLIGKEDEKGKNIAIILVSDRGLFNMLSSLKGVSLCQFSSFDQQDKTQQQMIASKEMHMFQSMKTYNFNENFEQIYKRLPLIRKV